MSHDIDSPDALDAACAGTWIRSTEFHPRHESTNDRALEVARQSNVTLPLLVLAREQTAGRGRGENVWWASPGALTFSMLLDPLKLGLPSERWAILSLATAMAVTRTLLSVEPTAPVAWKWPNDVYVGTQKICGILLEVPSTQPPRMVIGIGINVNNTVEEVSDRDASLATTAVSLSSIAGRSLDLSEVLRSFLGDFHDVVAELKKDPLHLSRVWQERDFLRDRRIVLKVGNRVVAGKAAGVDASGAIRIETADGKIESYPGGVIVEYGDTPTRQ